MNWAFFWWIMTMVVILMGWYQFLQFRMKKAVLLHEIALHKADINIAREVLARHPEDALDYANRVQKALNEIT